MANFTEFYKNRLLPAGLLAGTIIGAGIFSLPFVFQKVGLGVGLFYLALGTLVTIGIHLMYAEVVLRTPGEHRFVGYARMYYGSWAFWLGILMTIVQMILVMTIYLILSLSFSNLLFGPGYEVEKVMLFWLISSLPIFMNVRDLARLEFAVTGGIITIILFIFGLGIFGGHAPTLHWFIPDWKFFFLPFAPILFSLSGRTAIPSVVNYFRESPASAKLGKVRSAIMYGTMVPAAVYVLFIVGVLLLSPSVSEDAVTGLVTSGISGGVLYAVGFLGLISIWSSYLMIGFDIERTLFQDLGWGRLARIFVVVGSPLALYFSGLHSFLALISIAGGVFLSLEGIFVVCLWLKARKARGASITAAFFVVVFLSVLLAQFL